MTVRQSSSASASGKEKPEKPSKNFPLHAHASGQWAAKIKGQRRYFGPWDDPQAALKRYLEERDDLLAGRKPRPRTPDGLTIEALCNQFLDFKYQLVVAGELSRRHHDDLRRAGEAVVTEFGRGRMVEDLRPDDFASLRAKMAKRWGVSSLKRELANIKQAFNWAYKNDLIDRPVKFGTSFSAPSQKAQRAARAEASRMIEAHEIRTINDAATLSLRAMVLLAVNCGYGNSDIAHLEFRHLDLNSGWATFPRRKTGVARRAKLWPEAIAAVEAVTADRKAPRDAEHKQIVFLTKRRQPWVAVGNRANPISAEFRKIVEKLGIYRRGLSFYSLRHVFRTIGDESLDQPAVNYVMGHVDTTMAGVYRQRISDERLERVADHVHAWLFGEEANHE
ncbi:MAG: tyrosine-type recombinase/integrase [Pirellulaceae bacterium]